MGTDNIRLFNKAIADQILTLDQAGLTRFLDSNLLALKEKAFAISPVVFEIEENGGSVAEVVLRLLANDYTVSRLKSELVQDFALGDEVIHLDYWGCYAEVFGGHPEGSISSLDYLPDQEEETFLLLRPEHVDQMVKSLRDHADDLSIMTREQIEDVEKWKDHCAANVDFLVAYEFDF